MKAIELRSVLVDGWCCLFGFLPTRCREMGFYNFQSILKLTRRLLIRGTVVLARLSSRQRDISSFRLQSDNWVVLKQTCMRPTSLDQSSFTRT